VRQPWVRRIAADLLYIVAVALAAASPATALAQSAGASSAAATSMKLSCRTDYQAHCRGSEPSAPIAAACLAQFYVNLSKSCQTALDAYNAPQQKQPEEEE